MAKKRSSPHALRIGFVSTRFGATDGVSLETEKWATVLEKMGHTCFYFAGQSNRDAQHSYTVAEADFRHPENQQISEVLFTASSRPPEVTRRIHEIADYLKGHLETFVRQFEIDLLIVENALTIPMQIPLGIALTEFISETSFPTIAHHHDFYWERQRFFTNCIWDYLSMAFPPPLPSIQHVVINSIAGSELSRRTGISPVLIPNVMDFQTPPPPADPYTHAVRSDLGIELGEYLFLQPTRVVQRKGIEHAIELVSRLGTKARLVVSLASGDEGYEYEQRVRRFAELLKVPVNFVSDIIKDRRGSTPDGRKIYSLWDVYPYADIVTYPSSIEGFGNAFLETIYFKRPIVVNNYSIFQVDIQPKGFQVIEFDNYITDATVRATQKALEDKQWVHEMVEQNYDLGRRFYSFAVLERRLWVLAAECFGENLSFV
ncbi:MAG: glycosyltransferase family 4 protein [Chloroflexi bacterium]|nr:glycosyltransferase family 4 protein [Chloroflexota bacterium]